MMIMGGPKKLAAIIVSQNKSALPKSSVAMEVLQRMKEPQKIEVKKPEPSEEDAYKAAIVSQGKALLKAIKADDAEKFAMAMKDFISMCREDGDEEVEEEGES